MAAVSRFDVNSIAREISAFDTFYGDKLADNLVLLQLSGLLELDRSGLEFRGSWFSLFNCYTGGAGCHHIGGGDCHDADGNHDDFADVLLHNVQVFVDLNNNSPSGLIIFTIYYLF